MLPLKLNLQEQVSTLHLNVAFQNNLKGASEKHVIVENVIQHLL